MNKTNRIEKLPRYWHYLADEIFSPQAGGNGNEEKLTGLNAALPVPVVWLLGKTQAGKTSLIRTLSGRTDAEIGLGFKACTQKTELYAYPCPDHCLIKFMDTRGLGESAYDPAEDLQQLQEKAHVLMVVMRAMDANQQAVREALTSIRKNHPEWPVTVVQTHLHEGYPNMDFEHPQPYPFDKIDNNPQIPAALQRALLAQREWFKEIPGVRFVALDITRPEDAYAPTDYGAEALWQALQDVLPVGMGNLFSALHQGIKDHYTAAAHPHIIAYALLAATAEAVPLPMASVPLVLSVQAKLFQSLASIYKQQLSRERFIEIAGLLGTGYLLRMGGRQLTKLVPVYGQAVTALYSGATTYALGHMLCTYFERSRRGQNMTQAEFEEQFSANLEQAKAFMRDMLDKRKSS